LNWNARPIDEARVFALRKEYGLSRIAAILVSRLDLVEARSIRRFLNPKLTHLSSPFLIPNIDRAAERLIEAVMHHQSVFILGDYDVDGVTSTALAYDVLKELGLDPGFSVPKRTDDGYGMSLGLVKEKVCSGATAFDLVLALDCGSNDYDSVEFLAAQGVDVIVVDHHQIRRAPHPRMLLVNPHVSEEEGTSGKNLCSVALTFKLMQGMLSLMRDRNLLAPEVERIAMKDYLDLVTLGTLTDLVPLTGDNRIMVRYGLHLMGKSRHLGLQALMDVCSLPYGSELDTADVSYKIGPRLNAGGRMADATLSVNLLIGKNFNSCIKYAHELDLLNQNRQVTERSIYEQATQYLSLRTVKDAVVLYDPEWHTGVLGIVSSRLARQYHMPSVVLGSEGGYARGSARSVEHINIIEVLKRCDHLLESWGGHPMAAGISLRPENLEAFRDCFAAAITEIGGEQTLPKGNRDHIEVDAWIQNTDITPSFLEELRCLGPFGIANPEPILGMRNAHLASKVSRFGTDHFKCWVTLGGMDYDLMCLGWGFPSRIPENRHPLDLIFTLKWHQWKGRGYPQATLIDWKYSS
jgi:single-stranded-DNA-specific exonuclease